MRTEPELSARVLSERLVLRIPSRPEWIAPTIDYLKQRALLAGVCSESRVGKLMLALHEALTNSVVHGNLELSSDLKEQSDTAFAEALAERCQDPAFTGRTVTIETEYDGERCQWSLTDQGKGFDVDKYTKTGPPDDPMVWLSSGRGILLMRSFTDEIRYELGGRRVLLALRRKEGEDRRLHTRQFVNEKIRVAPLNPDGSIDWDGAHEGVARNFSPGGIAVLQSRLTATDRVILGIESGDEMLFVPAQIRHCRPVDEGMVELGCQFIVEGGPPRPTSAAQHNLDEAIATLMTHCQPILTPEHNRRQHPRESYTRRIDILETAKTPAVVGFARDLSKGGIAFVTTVEVPLETRVLSLPQTDCPPLLVQAQIVRCNMIVAGFYDVGARFLAIESGD